jgi:transposase-like protein
MRGARRNWRPEEKREIALASLVPGAMPSAICRQHGIGSGQLMLRPHRHLTRIHPVNAAGLTFPDFSAL